MEQKEEKKPETVKLYSGDSVVECAKESADFFKSRGYAEKGAKQPDKKE